MIRPAAWHRTFLAALLLAGACGAGAQGLPALPPADSATPVAPAPVAIAAPEIPNRADDDDQFAQDVLHRADQRKALAALEARLVALDKSVRAQARLFGDSELNTLPVTRLESIERHWRFFDRQYRLWRADLRLISDQTLGDSVDLARRRAAWDATRAAPGADDLPPTLLDRMTTVQRELAASETTLSAPLDRQLALGRRGNGIGTIIDRGQKAIAAAIAFNDDRLLRLDAPPIWAIHPEPASDGNFDSLVTGLELESQFAVEYNAANQGVRRTYAVAMVLVLAAMLWIGWRYRRRQSDDPSVAPALRVLRRPVSTWLLLASTGVLVFQPEAPVAVHQFFLLVALVPLLRVLPQRLYDVLGPWPMVATGLYLLNLLGFVFLASPYYHRVYVLVLTALALASLLWLLWRSRQRGTPGAVAIPAGTAAIVRAAGAVGSALLVVSLVANVFGNITLADMLTNALLVSGYVGLVLYAGVHVVSSLLRLALANPKVGQSRLGAQHGDKVVRSLTWLLRVAATTGATVITLNQFRVFRPLYAALTAIVTHQVTIGEVSLSLGNVLVFVLSVVFAFWLAKTVRYVLRDEVLTKVSLPRGVANSVASLSYYALLMLGLLFALAAAGFKIGQLTIVLGALGVGIGLGLQDVVRNFVSGLILMVERPIQPGDAIEVTGTSGRVREIGMRATTLTTFDGADVIVPNGTLLSEKLTNWTLSNTNRRIDLTVGLAYGSDPTRVLALLLQVTQQSPGIASTPAPAVFFSGFGASSLDFTIRAWTNNYGDWVRTQSDLAVRVHDAILAAGLEIPFPQTDLHLRSVPEGLRESLLDRKDAPAGDEPPESNPSPPRPPSHR